MNNYEIISKDNDQLFNKAYDCLDKLAKNSVKPSIIYMSVMPLATSTESNMRYDFGDTIVHNTRDLAKYLKMQKPVLFETALANDNEPVSDFTGVDDKHPLYFVIADNELNLLDQHHQNEMYQMLKQLNKANTPALRFIVLTNKALPGELTSSCKIDMCD